MTAARPVVAVRGLSKSYESVTAVDEVSFTVEAGTAVGLVGPAGAGKTTVLRVLLGLVRPTSGTVSVSGAGSVSGAVGAVLLPRGLHPARSARDHLSVYAAAARVPDERVDELLDSVRMAEHAATKAANMTAGQRTRVALATALLADPPLLILDDPTEGFDAAEGEWLQDFLRGHTRRGGTVLLSATSLASVVPMVDDLVVLSEGSVVYRGTPAKLRRGHPDRLVVAASTPVALATVLAARGYTDAVIRPDGRLAVAEATESEVVDAARTAGVRLDSITPDPIHPDRVLASLTTPRTASAPVFAAPGRFPTHPVAAARQPTPYGIPR